MFGTLDWRLIAWRRLLQIRSDVKKCGDIIESTHRHDFKFCKCGAVAVNGGKDYLRRCGNREEWEELSEYLTDA